MADRLLIEPTDGRTGEGGKARGDFGALGSLAYDIAGGATPGDQQQRIDDDGFSGTGFAREGREAGAEFELGLIDEHQIPQLKMRQHGWAFRLGGYPDRPLSIRRTAVSTAAPMKLGAQQPVVVIARRMQQRDLHIRALDIQVVALSQSADGRAVASHLRAGLETIRHAQLNLT